MKSRILRWLTARAHHLPGGKGPDFIWFGSQKSGTRWLYDQMNHRPDVWMPPIKEIDYFLRQCHKPKNVRSLLKLRAELANDAGSATARFVSMFEGCDRATCGLELCKGLFACSA